MAEKHGDSAPPIVDLNTLLLYARLWRGPLLLLAVVMAAETAIMLVIPWWAGRFAGATLTPGAAPPWSLVAVLSALLVLQAAIRYVSAYLSANTTERIITALRVRLFDHLQALPVGYFDARRHGDILAHLTNDAGQIADFLSGTLVSTIPMLFTFAGAFALMLTIDPILALAVLFLLPPAIVIFKLTGRSLREISAQHQQAYGHMMALAEENLSLLRAIKLFTLEGRQSQRFAAISQGAMNIANRQNKIVAALEPATALLAGLGLIILLWVGRERLVTGDLGAGPLVSFLLYAALLARPLSSLGALYGRTQVARGAISRLHALLGEPVESIAGAGVPITTAKGHLSFHGVTFAYPGRPPALKTLDLEIRAGETIAITGRNGSGKSTLVHLLSRLYSPQSGAILLDGQDIAGIELHSLRQQIGVVPQHVLLANASVRDNIAFGRPDAEVDAVIAAAKGAEAHDFITALPQGYDTTIGDHGVRLSGGQRQRLALARALIKDPPIIVLDEATAMFDPQAESAFVARCKQMLGGRTVILITHRPASLALADRIVHMEMGKIAHIESAQPSLRAAQLS